MPASLESALAEILTSPSVSDDRRADMLDRTQFLMTAMLVLARILGADAIVLVGLRDDRDKVAPTMHASTRNVRSLSARAGHDLVRVVDRWIDDHPQVRSEGLFKFDPGEEE